MPKVRSAICPPICPTCADGLQAQVKEAILKAFTLGGGEKYRMKVANDDPRTFCKLLGNIMALQVEGDRQHLITYTIYTGVPERDDIPGVFASFVVDC